MLWMENRWSLKIGAHRGTQVGTAAVETAEFGGRV